MRCLATAAVDNTLRCDILLLLEATTFSLIHGLAKIASIYVSLRLSVLLFILSGIINKENNATSKQTK